MTSKKAIIETAADIIVREGAENLTLSRVAQATGLSKPGLLYHFPSMKELLKEIVAWCDERYLDAYLGIIDTFEPSPGRTPKVYMQSVVTTFGNGSAKTDSVAAALYASASRTSLTDSAYVISFDRLRADCLADGGDLGEALSIIIAFDALCLGSALVHRLSREERGTIWTNLQSRVEILQRGGKK